MIKRKLTMAVAFAIAVESAGVFLWAGAASERLRQVETRVAAQSDTTERLARVEVRLQLAGAQLDRIEKKVDAR